LPVLRILLVEDHTDTREAIAELLRLYGHTIETADSVVTALTAVAAGGGDGCAFDLASATSASPTAAGST
jgi:CheY-like chemotaxis protein